MEELFKRIGKKINIIEISKNICKEYKFGEYTKHEFIFVGIDDLSYYLYTTKGKYVVKLMNHEKTSKDINEFIQKNLVIARNNIKAPKIILHNEKALFIYKDIKLVVIECIDGKDLYSLNERITKEDILKLIEILILFHNIQENIENMEYDEYCFMKIKYDYEKTKKILPKNIKKQVEDAIKEFDKIDLSRLPKCFIHGDLISTNIMKDKDNKLWLIDFYQSGNGVRILDIVKVLNSVIYNYQYEDNIEELEQYFLEEYSKKMPLTEYELEVLPILRKIDACTGIMLETYDLLKGNNNEENEYWLKNDKNILKRLNK